MVVDVKGSVTADTSSGPARPVEAGLASNAVLSGAGATIRTGPDGAATLVIPAAGIARLAANTEVRLPAWPASEVSLPAPPTGGNEKKTNTASQCGQQHLELLKGQLFLKIDPETVRKRREKTFRLKTPSALLAVKGTEFFVSTDGATDIAGVHEGSIWVFEPVGDKYVSLDGGSAVSIKPGEISDVRRLTPAERRFEANYDVTKIKRITLVGRWDSELPPEDKIAGSSVLVTNFSIKNPHGTIHTLKLGPALPGKTPSSVRDLLIDTRSVQGRPLAIEFLIKGGHDLRQATGYKPFTKVNYASGLDVRCGLSFATKAELHQSQVQAIPLQGIFDIKRQGKGYYCSYVQLFSNIQFPLGKTALSDTARFRFAVSRSTNGEGEMNKLREAIKYLRPSISDCRDHQNENFDGGIEITGVSMLVLSD
jgi:hypothetical protein